MNIALFTDNASENRGKDKLQFVLLKLNIHKTKLETRIRNFLGTSQNRIHC